MASISPYICKPFQKNVRLAFFVYLKKKHSANIIKTLVLCSNNTIGVYPVVRNVRVF